MIVRSAHARDAAGVHGLLVQLGYRLPLERVAAKLARAASDQLDAAFVAEEDDRVVGFIGVHAHELFHVEGRLGRITALIVDATARRAGIGSTLIAAAERFLREVACAKIEVTSADHRQDAHRFYEAHGFRRDERRFLKVLETAAAVRRD